MTSFNTHRRICQFFSILALLFTTTLTHAAEPTTPAALAEMLKPYVDEQTVIIAHVQLDQLDLAALEKSILNRFTNLDNKSIVPPDSIKQGFQAARTFQTSLKDAGVTHLFAVGTLASFPDQPGFLLLITNDNPKTGAIQNLLTTGKADLKDTDTAASPDAPKMLARKNAILFSSASSIDKVSQIQPTPRPEILTALELSPAASTHLLIVPSKTTFKVITDTLADFNIKLPQGDASILPFLKMPCWSLTDQPNNAGYKLVGQAPDASTAADASKSLQAWINIASNQVAHMLQTINEPKLADEINLSIRSIKPAANQSRVEVSITPDQFTLATGLILPAIASARQNAIQVQLSNQVRQLLMACIIYTSNHNNTYPADLKTALTDANIDLSLLKNPLLPGQDDGYIYLKPAGPIKNPATQVLIYAKSTSKDARIVVGYADGHVQSLTPAELQKAMPADKPRQTD